MDLAYFTRNPGLKNPVGRAVPADENDSYKQALSEKRDAVGTGRIKPAGKIATVAVVAECRDQGMDVPDDRVWFSCCKMGRMYERQEVLQINNNTGFFAKQKNATETGIPQVSANQEF